MKRIIIILAVMVAATSNVQAQTGDVFAQISMNSAGLRNMEKMNDYTNRLFGENSQVSPAVGFGVGCGFGISLTERMNIIAETGLTVSTFAKNTDDKYQRFTSSASSLSAEYFFLKDRNLSLKLGIGYDQTSLLYARRQPLKNDVMSYTFDNIYIPVSATWWINRYLGIEIQYNQIVRGGTGHITGINEKVSNMPNMSQNPLMIQVKMRLPGF